MRKQLQIAHFRALKPTLEPTMKTLTSLVALTTALVGFAASAIPAAALGKLDVPILRAPRPSISTSTYTCGNELGYLRRVYEEQVDGIADASIVAVCDGEDFGFMRSEGNAGAIRQHLADNEAVMDALDLTNFRVDDVIAVRMTGDDSAIIYVHTFLYR